MTHEIRMAPPDLRFMDHRLFVRFLDAADNRRRGAPDRRFSWRRVRKMSRTTRATEMKSSLVPFRPWSAGSH